MRAGSNSTSTVSACPVVCVHTSSYDGLSVCPPVYPTAVATTPGACRNASSTPQKHPAAKAASSLPARAVRGVPRPAWPASDPTASPCSAALSALSGRGAGGCPVVLAAVGAAAAGSTASTCSEGGVERHPEDAKVAAET